MFSYGLETMKKVAKLAEHGNPIQSRKCSRLLVSKEEDVFSLTVEPTRGSSSTLQRVRVREDGILVENTISPGGMRRHIMSAATKVA